jgi:hypothetical protein
MATVIRSCAEMSASQPPGILAVRIAKMYDLPLTVRPAHADPAGDRDERRNEGGSRRSAARRRLEGEALVPGFAQQSLPVSDTVGLDIV